MNPRRPRHVVTVAAALAGTALFVYAVRRVGTSEIIDGIQRVGWGLALVVMLAGVRFAVRGQCWRLCMAPGNRLTLRRALSAYLAGDALGNVTPLGLLASEPTKVFLTRHHLATRDSVASLALENLAYAASVLVMVGIGVAVMLATMHVSDSWRMIVLGSLVALIGVALVGPRLVRGMSNVSRFAPTALVDRIRRVHAQLPGFMPVDRVPLSGIFVLELSFHALAVFEVFMTLGWLLGDRSPSLAQAIVFETLNRVVTVAFKFVPLRVGVDEAFSAAVAPLLAVNPAAGIALAVVRKVRNLVWIAVGLLVIVTHPARGGYRGEGTRGLGD
jgi:hypothetical protein